MTARRALIVAIVSLGGVAASERSEATQQAVFSMIVQVRDYAVCPPQILRWAEQETARVFAGMGVRIEWQRVPGPQAISGDVPEFKVVILSPPMVAQKSSRQGITDTALASGVRETGHTYIFYDRIVAVSHRYGGSSLKDMLARVLTHELGHLISSGGHSDIGAMRRTLHVRGAESSAFTAAEGQAIRAALAKAMASGAPRLAVRAPGS
jgi:hypothetical protein